MAGGGRGGVNGITRGLGLATFLVGLVGDRLHKWWMLDVYDIPAKGRVAALPFLDYVMVWNTGVSYGLFDSFGEAGRFVLAGLGGFGTLVFLLLLWRAGNIAAAIGAGLIASGALSNAIDRVVYGAVADFFLVHAGGFEWYVFNIADAAIVVGVGLLVLSWLGERPEIAKKS